MTYALPVSPYPWRDPVLWQTPGLKMAVGRALCDDARYTTLWRATHDLERLERAGFFWDGLSSATRHAWRHMTSLTSEWAWTPVPPPTSFKDGARPVALLFMGAFAPWHEGHAAAVRAAVRDLQKKSHTLLACYVSPSHDGYVQTKDVVERIASWNATARIATIRAALRPLSKELGIPCLVDTWEAWGAPGPVNLTLVQERLEALLRLRHPDVCVKVLYGADNEGFTEVLGEAGVCVARPSIKPPAAHHLPCSHPAASRHLRHQAGCLSVKAPSLSMEPSLAQEVDLFNPDQPPLQECAPSPYGLMRDEDTWVWRPWVAPTRPAALLAARWEAWSCGLQEALQQAWSDTVGVHVPARRLNLEVQRELLAEWLDEARLCRHLVVCLDPVLGEGLSHPNGLFFHLSRRFRAADAQEKADGFFVRPLNTLQMGRWREQTVHLVDDDTSTGSTFERARQFIARTGGSVERHSTCVPPDTGVCWDVVDARDFLVGARQGGLCVHHLDTQTVRVPYLWPFVNLMTRARISASSFNTFAVRLWELNCAFHEGLDLTVHDMDAPQRAWWMALGETPQRPVYDLCCAWHRRAQEALKAAPFSPPEERAFSQKGVAL